MASMPSVAQPQRVWLQYALPPVTSVYHAQHDICLADTGTELMRPCIADPACQLDKH